MAFRLSAGTYTLTVSHPSFTQHREVEGTLGSGEPVAELVDVAPYSAERYFARSW